MLLRCRRGSLRIKLFSQLDSARRATQFGDLEDCEFCVMANRLIPFGSGTLSLPWHHRLILGDALECILALAMNLLPDTLGVWQVTMSYRPAVSSHWWTRNQPCVLTRAGDSISPNHPR
jgi:hypothetical protein